MDFDMDFAIPDLPEGDLDAELIDTAWISCPYCGEPSELLVDLAGGIIQQYVQDCDICCQPWLVNIHLDAEGFPSLSVATLDEE